MKELIDELYDKFQLKVSYSPHEAKSVPQADALTALWEYEKKQEIRQVVEKHLQPKQEKSKEVKKKTNKYGCRPREDVCLEHDEPLICKHWCSQAIEHRCNDLEE